MFCLRQTHYLGRFYKYSKQVWRHGSQHRLISKGGACLAWQRRKGNLVRRFVHMDAITPAMMIVFDCRADAARELRRYFKDRNIAPGHEMFFEVAALDKALSPFVERD